MRTLAAAADRDRVLGRLQRLTPESGRRWGTLTPDEALCHLADSFRTALGENVPRPRRTLLRNPIVRWLAMWAPFPWPHGIQTPPEVDPRRDGTRPGEFAGDREALVTLIERLAGAAERETAPEHPLLGPFTRRDWQRWGYLHLDHHLRQFGV